MTTDLGIAQFGQPLSLLPAGPVHRVGCGGVVNQAAQCRRSRYCVSADTAWKSQRDQAVKEALARPAVRPLADTRDKELARLRQFIAGVGA